jgi:cytochrome c oxidase subunit I+III
LATILVWLWRGTAVIPEKPAKHVGFDLTLPLYMSGQQSVGWWAMCITMLGDLTAFISLVFGYFFFWIARPDFLLDSPGPGWWWPVVAAALALSAWALTLYARHANRRDRARLVYACLASAAALATASAAALLAAPVTAGLEPTRHVYPATVWVLVIWTAVHLAAGVVMLLYCAARRAAGRLTAIHDIDLANVTLYWHFATLTALITVGVIAGFPELA